MLTFLQEILVLHLNDIPTGLFGQSKDVVDKKRNLKSPQTSESATIFLIRFETQYSLTQLSTPPE